MTHDFIDNIFSLKNIKIMIQKNMIKIQHYIIVVKKKWEKVRSHFVRNII